jgi:hypothetical protein
MRHIALIGIQLHGNDAGMLRGLFRFARQRPEWVIHDVVRPAVLAAGEVGNPCGAMANVIDPGVAACCAALGVPVVNVAGPVPGCEAFPPVGVDNAVVGRMAADHLWDCGFRQFAWFSHMPPFPFIAARGRAFEAGVRERRGRCAEPFDQEVSLSAHKTVGLSPVAVRRQTRGR